VDEVLADEPGFIVGQARRFVVITNARVLDGVNEVLADRMSVHESF